MNDKIKVTRVCAGSYEATFVGDDYGDHAITIDHEQGLGWVIRANWDAYLYSDPLPTYRRAKEEAANFLRHCLELG